MNYVLEIDKRAKTTGNYETACDELIALGLEKEEVRKFFDSYIEKTRAEYIEQQYENLKSSNGIILLCGVAVNGRMKDLASKILEDDVFCQIAETDGMLKEYVHQLEDIVK